MKKIFSTQIFSTLLAGPVFVLFGLSAIGGAGINAATAAGPAGNSSGNAAANAPVAPLVTPIELKALLDRKAVRVLDIRELLQGDNATPNHAAGHIPGAVAAPYSSIRGPESNPGLVLSDQEFTRLFRKWGIGPDSHVVIAHTGADPSDFGGAARFFWTLKVAGIDKVSILDGGFGAWGALKLPIETGTTTVAASNITVKLDRSQIPTTSEIADLVQKKNSGGKKFLLTDSRSEDYFTGTEKHSAAARAGTLPGAKNFDHEEWFQLNTGKLLPKKDLEALAKSAGLITGDEVIAFCNTGHWSATTWFVLSQILGQKNVRMYPESTIGWSKSKNPMDNEPARGKVLINQLKDAVNGLKN